MPYNGSGTFALYSPGNPVVTNTTISSTWWNNTGGDLATGLSTAVCKDGQTTTTQRIPFAAGASMGSQTITAVAAGTATTHAANVGQLQSSAVITLGTVAGTNTITAAGTPAVAAYAAGQAFEFTPANTNTGATTINIDSVDAKNIFFNGAALIGGELRANIPVRIKYDGTQFHIIGNGSGRGWQLLATGAASDSATLDFTALTSTYDLYMLTFDIAPATDDVYLALRIGTGGTPTYQTSGYEWGGALLGLSGTANIGSTADSVADRIAISRPGTGNGVGNASGGHICGEVYFSNPDSANDYFLCNVSTRYVRSDNAGQGVTVFGRYGGGGPITGLRMLFSSGNIASGTAQLYGLRK